MNGKTIEAALSAKQDALFAILKRFSSLAVAFSGGVDSTFLLWAAGKVLKENVTALTAVSPLHPERELLLSRKMAGVLNVGQIEFPSREMASSAFRANPRNRCYLCKRMLIEDMNAILRDTGVRDLAHGVNTDDLYDFRPGLKAAREAGVHEPLVEAGLSKAEIRTLSRLAGLETWNRPAMACLATRIPYGMEIRDDVISRIAEAEEYLIEKNFQGCRVRVHGDTARIEVPEEKIAMLAGEDVRSGIVRKFKKIGFTRIALDLEGYVQGSMNSLPDGD